MLIEKLKPGHEEFAAVWTVTATNPAEAQMLMMMFEAFQEQYGPQRGDVIPADHEVDGHPADTQPSAYIQNRVRWAGILGPLTATIDRMKKDEVAETPRWAGVRRVLAESKRKLMSETELLPQDRERLLEEFKSLEAAMPPSVEGPRRGRCVDAGPSRR